MFKSVIPRSSIESLCDSRQKTSPKVIEVSFTFRLGYKNTYFSLKFIESELLAENVEQH